VKPGSPGADFKRSPRETLLLELQLQPGLLHRKVSQANRRSTPEVALTQTWHNFESETPRSALCLPNKCLISNGAGRGNRTPMGLRPKVFETFASASSAIPARMDRTRLRDRPLIYSALASRLRRSARTAALSPGGERDEMVGPGPV
jgi:hypothetical protein